MRLKKIKLAGFKSFVDPTTIPFPSEMTAVVGPNGCGKSNVIDAVRWVLGESSAKNLRGDAMTDVIFNGSTARKAVSQCSVELVFDNSSGRIQGEFAGYNELSVKRIVTKDAQSSYLLNNTKCRKRDITDLFLGTGLGPRSYAIIEQGMISRLIESKPQELRVFIEEAAGVSKYKERRRETETRIRHTKENLERLEDVRGELGQQLEKLQRQAAAAKRFKELKQNERKYKAELAAIRWLKHSNKIELLEKDIEQKNSEIEEYVAQQRGEEKDITLFKEQQQDFKQNIANYQQQAFKVGTDITRIEQNQIHTKQRRQQVEQELQTLRSSIHEHELHQQQSNEKIAELFNQLEVAQPEKEMLDEQVEQLQFALIEAEDQFMHLQNQWRTQEQEFNQRKAQVQSCHSKIQSLMTMQLRTQDRIGELKDELNEILDQDLELEITSHQEHILELEQQTEELTSQEHELEEQYQQALTAVKKLEQESFEHQGKLQTNNAQLDALQALQESELNSIETKELSQKLGVDVQSWWQSLDIQAGWEDAFETVCQQWQQALLVKNLDNSLNLDFPTLSKEVGVSWIFESAYTSNIPQHSLASKVNATSVPVWLTHILLADDLPQAQALLSNLSELQSVVTLDGHWLTSQWLVNPQSDNQASVLKRANQIKTLEQEKLNLVKALQDKQVDLEPASNALNKADKLRNNHKESQQSVTRNQELTKGKLQLLEQQKQQNLSRNNRLSLELNRHQETLQDEQQELEELSMQAEELEVGLEDLQENQLGFEQNKQVEQQKVNQCRINLDASKNKLHQLALNVQTIQSQYDGLKNNLSRENQLLTNLQEKLALLEAESVELALPLEDQEEALQELLEQKAEIELSQSLLNQQLLEVEEKLSVAEKGQQGVTNKIQAMLTDLQSIKLECEGYRVRANGFVEQLQEMQQNLKLVLESLPTDADENTWQGLLEKTTASVGRLGAVNLAAVEEYEIQAQRKHHLDTQNDDLVSALDILEQAIRKIDKETRSRFKETFEQVNDDLKMLFPKVFGGGSAYLELTDDDLLETGVTIMARPPGKKNSTIHLLSGGEKALTALSLVFAIFRLNPAPFCLLDEVDAPLDDANVGRFCKLVSEMSKSVQFIYITHNKIAMEMATHLTGVTMAEPGVSRMVAVDVDEAVAIAQA
ncbi:chromosome segregation protein SMC [Paraglaciecola aquimarina]|uniref:Chromosome partition protein Smc n=1 Tax=Paraglaciecola algarum TaxID=3050085 RepID=A0ABS9D604_9ALTE|nr:chromosome segregation protein SMC [Paraglaciecola sp. G1-23]MCF2947111.1 chromosome segregation protein SMC [Paraglaciecola sp. G1-23]